MGKSGLAFIIVIIVALIVAYLSLTNMAAANNMGKTGEGKQDTTVENARNAVNEINQATQDDLDKYEHMYD